MACCWAGIAARRPLLRLSKTTWPWQRRAALHCHHGNRHFRRNAARRIARRHHCGAQAAALETGGLVPLVTRGETRAAYAVTCAIGKSGLARESGGLARCIKHLFSPICGGLAAGLGAFA